MKKIRTVGRVLTLTALAALALVASARAEINLVNSRLSTNLTALTITNAETRTLTGSVIELRKNSGLSFMPLFRATNDTTANVTFRGRVSNDLSNWTTVPEEYTRSLNGTNWIRGYKFWGPDVLGGVRYFQFYEVVNGHTNSISISNAIVSQFN